MAYGHSFATGFYYDEAEDAPNKSKRPTSVSMALRSMPRRLWNEMAREVFNCAGKFLDVDTVMDKIMETDTVSCLTSPVEVWIDSEGYYRIDVYDCKE